MDPNYEMQLRLQEAEKRRKLTFNQETIVDLLTGLKASPPTPTDGTHRDEWWNTTFGKVIKTEWSRRVDEVIDHVKNLRNPW